MDLDRWGLDRRYAAWFARDGVAAWGVGGEARVVGLWSSYRALSGWKEIKVK